MTSEEKIRLVLDVLGVDNVSKATKELRDLNQQIGSVGTASGQAAGSKMAGGQGLLTLAYAVDDLQYGMRGIMNNIPQVVQALGLGAGLAGVAGIAAVAIGQLTQRHPEWFEWTNKVKVALGELTDAIKAEEAALERQKKTVDELSKRDNIRYEDYLKLIAATENLKEKEDALNKQRAAEKAAEEQAKDPGILAKENVEKMKQAYDEAIVQPGFAEGVQDASIRNRFGQLREGINDEMLADFASKFDGKFDQEVLDMSLGTVNGIGEVGNQMPIEEARKIILKKNRQKYLPLVDRELRKQAEAEVKALIGGMAQATTPQEFEKLFEEFSRVNPGAAQAAREQFQFTRSEEELNREVDESIKGVKGATAKSKAFADKMAAIGPNGQTFKNAQNQEAIKQRAEAEKANEADLTQQAAIRNQVLGQFDPLQAALVRRTQLGRFGSKRGLQQLEQRDINTMTQALMQGGMGRGEAEEAAMQSLKGGEESFQQLAGQLGREVDSVSEGFAAAIAIMQRQAIASQEREARNNQVRQQLEMMGNGDMRAPARPQMQRRMSR